MDIKCTAVLIDTMFSKEEVSKFLSQSDVVAVIISPSMLHKVDSVSNDILVLNIFDISVSFLMKFKKRLHSFISLIKHMQDVFPVFLRCLIIYTHSSLETKQKPKSDDCLMKVVANQQCIKPY